MKKTFHLAALLLLIPMVLCSCTASQPDDAPASASPALLLGFSQLGAESAWRLGNTRSIQEAAEKAGVALMYLILVMIFTWLLGKLEGRLAKSDRR